jgi:hypothetical protein
MTKTNWLKIACWVDTIIYIAAGTILSKGTYGSILLQEMSNIEFHLYTASFVIIIILYIRYCLNACYDRLDRINWKAYNESKGIQVDD